MTLRFHSVDTLTGRIVGRLDPHKWTLTDPLRTPGTGSLTVAMPTAANHDRLVEATLPRRRWIAVQDDLDRFLWCGPIPSEPSHSDAEITIPLVDWRAWFYKTPVRPLTNGTRRHYFAVAKEQADIYWDLYTLALDTEGAPAMVIDTQAATDVDRDVTAYMLERSIAEHLDDVRDRGGPEWYCYCTQSDDPTVLTLHVKTCWPERRLRDIPIKVEWRVGKGGNVTDTPSWPGGEDVPTRVWGYGEGEPTDWPFTSDEYEGIEAGTEVAWEHVLSSLPGVKTTATVHDHCFEAIRRSQGLAGLAEFAIVDKKPGAKEGLALGDVMTGDRARVVFNNGWTNVDIEAARIVERTISGGPGEPTQQRLTVDLADDQYPDESGEPGTGGAAEPGEHVTDDE